MGDLGIHIEVSKKAFHRVEHVDERIVDRFYALGCLMYTAVTRIRI
jgi:hypothetical protein